MLRFEVRQRVTDAAAAQVDDVVVPKLVVLREEHPFLDDERLGVPADDLAEPVPLGADHGHTVMHIVPGPSHRPPPSRYDLQTVHPGGRRYGSVSEAARPTDRGRRPGRCTFNDQTKGRRVMSHGAVDSTGLLGLVSKELTPDLVHRAALQLGENEDRTRSALSASIPSVLTTLSDVASSHDG